MVMHHALKDLLESDLDAEVNGLVREVIVALSRNAFAIREMGL